MATPTVASKKKLRTRPIPDYKIVEGTLRHFTMYRDHFGHSGDHVIDHSYLVYYDDGTVKEKITTFVSLWDLFQGVKKLSPRKKEAIWWIAIMGYTQEEVGKIMNCRAVTCGEYLKAACQQLAKEIYREETEDPLAPQI